MSDIPGGSLTLAGIFLMGLGLNLTPCVYPMMSVTVSLFGGKKHHHLAAFLHAVVYVLGICFTYSILGAVAARGRAAARVARGGAAPVPSASRASR